MKLSKFKIYFSEFKLFYPFFLPKKRYIKIFIVG